MVTAICNPRMAKTFLMKPENEKNRFSNKNKEKRKRMEAKEKRMEKSELSLSERGPT